MERINNIISNSDKLIENIYEKRTVIDNCQALLPKLDQGEVSIFLNDGTFADLKKAINDEQMADLLYSVRSIIKKNMNTAADELDKLYMGSITPIKVNVSDSDTKHDGEEAITQQEKVNKNPDTTATSSDAGKDKGTLLHKKMDIETVSNMLSEGKTYQQIAEHFGYKCDDTVRKFARTNKLGAFAEKGTGQQDKAKPEVEPYMFSGDDINLIEKKYTRGSYTLGEMAKELGVSKKELHEFINANHLVKPVDDERKM